MKKLLITVLLLLGCEHSPIGESGGNTTNCTVYFWASNDFYLDYYYRVSVNSPIWYPETEFFYPEQEYGASEEDYPKPPNTPEEWGCYTFSVILDDIDDVTLDFHDYSFSYNHTMSYYGDTTISNTSGHTKYLIY